ncbi:MAG TPA: TadE/TadG family type IV pilus assembly protein [Trebonia sp.]|jgi:Flp pilus assembly protein TadG
MRTPAPAVREFPRRRRLAGSRVGRARRRRARGDRGAGSAEIVIAVPLLMLLILLVIQFAIWANAESIAHATAEEALAAARVQGGTAASGQQRAQQVISQVGSSVLVGPQVSVNVSAADVTVTVTGTAERVLPVPGLTFGVTATVTGPVERFVPASAQG